MPDRRPLPITEYVLNVHEPAGDEPSVSRDPVTGTMTLPAFTRSVVFVPASDPFPIPHVGDEIEVTFEDAGNDHPPAVKVPPRVVTRVRHRVRAKPDGIVCTTDVYTRER